MLYVPNTDCGGTRVRQLSVTPELLLELLKSLTVRRTFTATGLPTDATLSGAYWDPQTRQIRLLIASESFPNVQPGCALLEMTVALEEFTIPAPLHR